MSVDPARPEADVAASGERSIAIGRDAVGSIFVTGGTNQFFTGPYERLAEPYIDARSLYDELPLERFVGREWLVDRIDRFIRGNDRGYFVLEGGVGVGKTIFMAWLARERAYVHHFVQFAPRDAGAALRNLSAQLIRTWDLSSRAIGGTLPVDTARPDVFYGLLAETSERRDQVRPGEPIVIVIDGLNEAEPEVTPNGNVLSLPASIPRGVYVIVSQRPTSVPLTVKVPLDVGELATDSRDNLEDMASYLREVVSRWPMNGPRQQPEDVVRALLRASGGVWIYLHYVVAEIESGKRDPANLDSLPGGLWQYYAQYWQRWQREHPQEWRNLHSPLLNTLAAAGEPLPPGQLATLAGLADVATVDLLLSVEWRPFVHQVPDSDGFRYGIFHASFREFMEGQVETGSLRSAERAVAHQMAMATRAAHAAIADRYLTAWGGLETLAGLRDPELSRMDDGYGLRHLAKHLVAARRDEDLHRLLWVGWTSETVPEAPGGHVVNAWREAHERVAMLSEYLGDLQQAWLLAEAAAGADVQGQRVSPAIPLMLRYALLTASVNSLAANLPPNLLRELVQRDRLPLAEALAYARRGPDPLGRSEALLALGIDLEEPQRSETLLEALGAAQAIDDEQWRTGALTRIVPHLPKSARTEAAAVAGTIRDAYWSRAATEAVEAYLGTGVPPDLDGQQNRDPGDDSWYKPELALAHAVAVAQAIEHRPREVLARLTTRLPAPPGPNAVTSAFDQVRAIRQDRWRAEALTALGAVAGGEASDRALDEALAAARAVGDSDEHGLAMTAVARRLASAGEFGPAIRNAMAIADPYRRCATLAGFANSLTEPLHSAAREATLTALPSIRKEVQRARVLREHPVLCLSDGDPPTLNATVLDVVTDDYWRATVMVALVPLLAGDVAQRYLAELLTTAERLADQHRRADLLVRLLPGLAGSELERAIAAGGGLDEPDSHGSWAGAVAHRLAETQQRERAVELADRIEDRQWRTRALRQLLPLLVGVDPALALAVARRIPYPHWQSEALVLLGGVAANADVRAEGLALAREAEDPGARAELLGRLARRVDEPERSALFAEALDASGRLDQPAARWNALSALAGFQAETGRQTEALTSVDQIDDMYFRAEALMRITPLLGDEMLRPALERATAITHEQQRALVLAGLIPRFSRVPATQLHLIWSDTLRVLGLGTRQELLLALPGLLPALERLGGRTAIVDCADVVESVRRWWP